MKASRPTGAAAPTIGLAAGFAASTVATAAIGGAMVGALTAAGTTALSTHLQNGQMDNEAVLRSMLEGWLWGAAGSLGGTAASSIVGNALYNPVKSVGTSVGQTPVIGKMNDMKNVGINEYRVADLLPDQGSPKANWNQNSSVLRSIMNQGNPIRDASPFNSSLDPKLGISGTQNANTFLHMERNLLYDHGWRYSNGFWSLP